MEIHFILYFLTEGEIISFTNCEYTAQNDQYEIDNIPNRKIWFSQLSNFYFSDDFDSICQPIIKFKDGSSYVISESFDESTFFNKVKNKKFKVDIITDAPYIVVDSKKYVLRNKVNLDFKKITLNEKNQMQGYEDEGSADIAAFVFDDLNIPSPLILSDSLPKYGQSLHSDFYHRLQVDNNKEQKAVVINAQKMK